jgi:hypothetical protein
VQSNVLAGDEARGAASEGFAEAVATGGTHPGRAGDSARHGARRRGRGRGHRGAGNTQGRDDAPAHRAGCRPLRSRAHLSYTAPLSVRTQAPTRRVPRPPEAGAGIARAPRTGRTALAEPGRADHRPGRDQEVAGHRRGDREFKKNNHNSDDFPQWEKSFFCDDVRASTAKRERRDRRVGGGRSASTRSGVVKVALRLVPAASAVASMSVRK